MHADSIVNDTVEGCDRMPQTTISTLTSAVCAASQKTELLAEAPPVCACAVH